MVDKIGRLAVGQPGDMWGGGGVCMTDDFKNKGV